MRPKPTYCGGTGALILQVVPPLASQRCSPSKPGFESICNAAAKTAAILAEIETKARTATASNPGNLRCCDAIGNVHVIRESKTVDPNNAEQRSNVLHTGTQVSNSSEIISHEWGHLIIQRYNDILRGSNSAFDNAFEEGMSDVFAGLYGAVSAQPGFGDPFIYGDGAGYGNSPVRDAKNNNYTWASATDTAVEVHARGRVFLDFFERLHAASPATSYERLLAIAVGTMIGFNDADADGYDSLDFQRAVLATLDPSETALRAAVLSAWQAMSGTSSSPYPPPTSPGSPGPSGTPIPVASLWGAYSHCSTSNGAGVTVYSASWIASPNTSTYVGYIRLGSNLDYEYSAAFPGTTTSAFVYANTTADGRLAACNGFGCSGLSVDKISVTHRAACGGQ